MSNTLTELFPAEKSSLEKMKILFAQYNTLSWAWDNETNTPRIGKMLSARGLSSGEQIIVKCLIAIWRGNCTNNLIDITDIAALPMQDKRPILFWMANPFWK